MINKKLFSSYLLVLLCCTMTLTPTHARNQTPDNSGSSWHAVGALSALALGWELWSLHDQYCAQVPEQKRTYSNWGNYLYTHANPFAAKTWRTRPLYCLALAGASATVARTALKRQSTTSGAQPAPQRTTGTTAVALRTGAQRAPNAAQYSQRTTFGAAAPVASAPPNARRQQAVRTELMASTYGSGDVDADMLQAMANSLADQTVPQHVVPALSSRPTTRLMPAPRVPTQTAATVLAEAHAAAAYANQSTVVSLPGTDEVSVTLVGPASYFLPFSEISALTDDVVSTSLRATPPAQPTNLFDYCLRLRNTLNNDESITEVATAVTVESAARSHLNKEVLESLVKDQRVMYIKGDFPEAQFTLVDHCARGLFAIMGKCAHGRALTQEDRALVHVMKKHIISRPTSRTPYAINFAR